MAAFSFIQMKSYNAGAGPFTASSAAANSGGNTVYTGAFSDDLAGHSCVISGFANANNNGTFTVQGNTTTTLTVNNPNGVAQSTASTGNVNFGSPSVNSLSVQITPTTGNFLIAVTWIGNSSGQTVTNVSDPVNGTYSNTGLHVNNGGVNSGTSLDMWYAPVVTGGLTTVTTTWPSGGGYSAFSVAEYSGVTSFDHGSILSTSSVDPSITLITPNSNELLIWTMITHTFITVVWDQVLMTSRASVNNGGPVANSAFAFGEQSNPHYYQTGSAALGTSEPFIMQAAAFKTSTTVNNTVFPYVGYGSLESGGVALPAQEPSRVIFNNQFSFLPAPITGGERGPANSGVLYQGAGGGSTSGFGQIYPTGREPIG